MNDSDATPMSNASTEAEKWKNLPPAIRRVVSGDDGPPSEYGMQVGVDDHPLRRFYRDAEAEAMRAGTATRTGKRTEKRGDAR